MPNTPDDATLSGVHADLVGRLKHDERLRAVEEEMAETRAVVRDLPRMEARIMAAIEKNRAEPPWKMITALVAVITIVFLVAGAIYTGGPGIDG